MPELTIGLHKKQKEIYQDKHRVRVVGAGRRFGKTRLTIVDALLSALNFDGHIDPLSPETILLTEPTLVMARQVLWLPLVSLCEQPFVKPYIYDINKSSLRIDFVGGKPPIVVAGANDSDGDGLRGKRLYRYYGDELQDMKPGVFDTVIRPAMSDTPGSRALLTFTPKGKLNHTYELAQRQQVDPELYRFFHARAIDNPFISRKEIALARKTMPPRLFRQELEASFEDFAGQIYQELTHDHIISLSTLPHFDQLVIGVDWGDTNPAIAIWLYSHEVGWWYVDGWQGDGTGPVAQPVFDGHLVRLATKYQHVAKQGWVLADPSRPSSILAVRALGTARGLSVLKNAVAGFNRIEEGIIQVASLVYQDRLKFVNHPLQEPTDVSGSKAYELFASYRRATDKQGNVTDKVADGQDDHIVDASRYALARATGFAL
jgi:hypothetical protein